MASAQLAGQPPQPPQQSVEASASASASVTQQQPVSSRPNLDGILLLEQPFARLPFDELRRQQRTQQRLIEREFIFCSSTLNDLEAKVAASRPPPASSSPLPHPSPSPSSSSSDPDAVRQEAERSLDAMLGRLRGLKRKMLPLAQQSKQTLRMAQSRTDHLSNLHSIDSSASPEFAEWSKVRLDRMLVDFMLRRGYRSSADELAKARGIQDLVDTDLFAEIATIEQSLVPPGWQLNNDHNGHDDGDGDEDDGQASVRGSRNAAAAAAAAAVPSCTAALAWCSENKTMLRKIKSPLEFDLRLQEYIELVRVRTPESLREAIAYLRRHLLPMHSAAVAALAAMPSASSPSKAAAAESASLDKDAEYDRSAHEAIKKQVSRAMGLIACGPDGWAYEDLYTPYRWLSLRDSFRVCALQIHSLPLQPILHIALSAGLSSLKVPACYSHEARSLVAGSTGAPAHLGGRTAADAASAALIEGGHATQSDAVSVPSRFPPAMGGGSSSAGGGVDGSSSGSGSGSALDRGEGGARAPGGSSPLSYLGSMMSSGIAPHTHAQALARGRATGRPTTDDRNIDCPVCDTDGLGTLAREVPWSHHANSTLVCSLSGKVMDENNPPMAMPNGRVYALSALEEMVDKSRDGSTIVCPRTSETYSFASLRKVFIS
ncbi:uncharacterized protein PFL1_02727 [Pseudozyma flocculosa PF-1]|uniref:Macrophage erythroblast attacher n=2 Tax=Pseudozyma flocculosa TaxID=84751 RepID=A0A5C3F0U2_9BASI|nr:uncharacterized protein PFL1_02727 [Pseudozyma flocculosa PF-1]EPQ29508.1 hypothetical protein PFL1_02727 [Pseudozyma flocculosa PF-1]SPO38048.1 uncharacterized protein PSFLO_03525 [Pseudozyma flocculosa]